MALFLAALATACSGSDGDGAGETAPPPVGPESTAVPPPASTTRDLQAPGTSSTTGVAPSRPTCPPGEPIAVADLDGDGVDEDLLITEREGGQALWACGTDSARSLDLEYAVWYLGVVDLEADGVDEVFLGAAGNDDAPGVVDTRLLWIRPLAGRLDAYTDNNAGVDVGPKSGADCDSDGDDVIALLSTFLCGDGSVDLIRVEPPPAICEREEPLSSELVTVDLDDDGLDDLVRQRQTTAGNVPLGLYFGGPSLVVCLGSGATDEVLVGGVGRFNVSAGPGDQPIIWSSRFSGRAVFSDPIAVDDGRLVFVSDEDGIDLTFWGGSPNDDGEWGVWGCSDVDGNGTDELVQVVATLGGNHVDWTRRTWSMQGANAVSGQFDSGSLPLPADFESQGWWNSLRDITPNACPPVLGMTA